MVEVTVGVPTYNQNPIFFRKCLESIIGQTYPREKIEIIVMDDGSNNKEEVEKISKEFGAKYFYQKNMGIGSARKAIVDKVCSKFIAFCSSDDAYMPDYIETMLEESKKHPNSVLYSNFDTINENGTYVRTFNADTYDCYEDWLMSIIFKAHNDTMSVCYNIFAPTKILKKNNFDESLRYGEDLEHLLRCTFIKKIKYHLVPKILFQYRQHIGSVTSRKIDDIKENNKRIFDKINLTVGRRIL